MKMKKMIMFNKRSHVLANCSGGIAKLEVQFHTNQKMSTQTMEQN